MLNQVAVNEKWASIVIDNSAALSTVVNSEEVLALLKKKNIGEVSVSNETKRFVNLKYDSIFKTQCGVSGEFDITGLLLKLSKDLNFEGNQVGFLREPFGAFENNNKIKIKVKNDQTIDYVLDAIAKKLGAQGWIARVKKPSQLAVTNVGNVKGGSVKEGALSLYFISLRFF